MALVPVDVVPTAELVPHVLVAAGFEETERTVEREAGFLAADYPGHYDVDVHATGLFEDCAEKGLADAAAAERVRDVDRFVGGLLICLLRAPGGEATPTRNLAGRISQDEMLRAARKDKQMERLNLSEAWFYIGQRLLLAGDTESARRMFQRTVDIGALPYREHAFAQLELRRASAR